MAKELRRDRPEEGTVKPAAPAKAARAGTSRAWRDALHDERITHLIRTAFRCTSSALQRRLKREDVLYGHWTFLRILWQTDGLTQRQLSEQAGVTEPSTVTALQSMEKLGYLTRQKMPGNKKQIRVFLAPKGMALRSLIVPCAEEVNRIVIAGISAEDLAATRRTLLAVIENLNGDSDDSSELGGAAERLEAQELR